MGSESDRKREKTAPMPLLLFKGIFKEEGELKAEIIWKLSTFQWFMLQVKG